MTEPARRRAVAPRARGRAVTGHHVALAGIVGGGVVLRLLGIRWGLPMRLHPDEWAIVEGAIDMARRNSFEPAYFMRPDHLEMQLGYLLYMAYAHVVRGAPPEVVFLTDPGPFVAISRGVTAACGVASIVVAYLIGRRFSSASALTAGFLVAFFPPYVLNAHYAAPDVPLTLTFLCVILACVRYVERPGWKPLIAASLAVAASVAIKYPGALGMLVVALAVLVGAARDRASWRAARHGAAAVATATLALFAISPVLFTNLTAVVEAVKGEAGFEHPGADGLGFAGNLWFYASQTARFFGVAVLVLAVVGGVWAARARRLDATPLLGGAVIWVPLSALPLHWDRWALPMHVTVILLAALGMPVVLGLRWVRVSTRPPAIGRLAVLGVVVLASTALVLTSVATTAGFLTTDTRVASARTLPARGVTPENSVYEGYTPFSPWSLGEVFSRFTVVAGRLEPLVPEGTPRPRYLLLSSSMGDRYLADARYADEQAFYARVESEFRLLETYRSATPVRESALVVPTLVDSLRYLWDLRGGAMVGPTIRLFEIPGSG